MALSGRIHDVFVLMIAICSIGCGGVSIKPFDNIVRCSGTVTLDGKPLPSGSVAFVPIDVAVGQPAVGTINSGKFEMVTTVSSPGVIAGKYQVCVQAFDPMQTIETAEPGQAPIAPRSLIPKKYTDVSTSGWTVDVAPGMDPLHLELTSDK